MFIMKLKIITIIIIVLLPTILYLGDSIGSPDEAMAKIIKRNSLESEGWELAKQGFYDQALVKYKAAQNPALLNYDYEKPELPIILIYIRQEKYEEALAIVSEDLKHRPDNTELNRQYKEIASLINARDSKTHKPIYEYILWLRQTYSKYFPPEGYGVGMTDWFVEDLIHLYDFMRDYNSGIALMDEMIKYHTQHTDPAHRSAHVKDAKEYQRVKEAWELDKKTGKHGHLQEVIRTSDIIGW